MPESDDTPQHPRRFLIAFSVTLLTLIAGVAVLNWIVDPFAQYGSGRFASVVRTSRGEKLRLLEAFGPPDGLILGSSRVMKLEPQYLAHKTGLKFFNAGVYYGRPEDYLALLRSYHAVFHRWPKSVMVGIDIDAFVEHPGPDARLIRNELLRSQVQELLTLDDRTRRYRELLSWQQTTASVRSLARGEAMRREAAEEESFEFDGKIVYHRREAELSQGEYDLASACEYTRKEYRRLFQHYERLSPMRVQAWRTFTEICRTEEIEVVAFITPWREETLASVESTGVFADRHADVTSLVLETLPPLGRLADFTQIESFGGNPELFVDGVHPLEANTRRMIDALFSDRPLLVSQARHAL